jgi:hypothetical protein
MPREAKLFEVTSGSPLEACILLRRGGQNMPANWIERASETRKHKENLVAKALEEDSLESEVELTLV